jgi:hypothetical protein
MSTVHIPLSARCLGKGPVRFDARTLRFSRYRKALPPVPNSLGWTSKIGMLGMMLNDQLGDCVVAGYGHSVQEWTAYAAGAPSIIPDNVVLKGYEDVGGYVPGDPSTDNGCVMLDALKYFRRKGLGGHVIQAFVAVNPLDELEVREAIHLFGSLYIGLDLPVSAQNQYTWHVPASGITAGDGVPGSWGGHCVPVMGYSPLTLNTITWGARQEMTWEFLRAYCSEAYAMLSKEWIAVNGLSPSRFDMAQLLFDLQNL